MKFLDPINQTQLFGLEKFISEFIKLDKKGVFPNQILLSGQKGLGKSTLALHFINYILSKDEPFKYDISNFKIDAQNQSFKTILNKSNPNFNLIDITSEKKNIDLNQIRELISNLNKSSFNNKPRFVLIDNVEFLNINSVNALLKTLEEPSINVFFILINNNKKLLSTITSRCINFKITLNNDENLNIANKLLNGNLYEKINKDLINYYSTAGNIYNLYKFAQTNDLDICKLNLKDFLKILIRENYYKKNDFMKYFIFDFVEYYFIKKNFSLPSKINEKYNYFLKKISDTKRFNLDEDTLFMEFEDQILNG